MKTPNIIFMLIDDLGWRDLSYYGSDFYETPNIDALAGESAVFTQAYSTCPVCSPARASFLTGKYPARLHLTNYLFGEERGILRCPPYKKYLDESEYTIASALRDRGYKTCHIGKWHLGGPGCIPEKHGFDVNFGGCHMGCPHTYFSPYNIPTLADGPDGEYLTDRLTDEAVKYIGDSDGEFFMFMSHYTVHAPLQAHEPDIEYFRQKAKRLNRDKINPIVEGENFPCEHQKHMKLMRRIIQSDPVYAAMIYNLDMNVGRILAALKQKGIYEDTIFVFTSDNGGESSTNGSATCNAPLAEGKGWMYDGGIREPLIVSYPGKIGHMHIDTPTINTDFYPTLLSLAGLGGEPSQHIDGVDITPLFGKDPGEGENIKALENRALFWHYPHYGNQGGSPAAAVRQNGYKLIKFFERGNCELYDMDADISETRDLSEQMPERTASMLATLEDWLADTSAMIPEKA